MGDSIDLIAHKKQTKREAKDSREVFFYFQFFFLFQDRRKSFDIIQLGLVHLDQPTPLKSPPKGEDNKQAIKQSRTTEEGR